MISNEQRKTIVKYLEQTLSKMRGLFSDFYINSIELMKDQIKAGADFSWSEFQSQSQKIDKMIDVLVGKTDALIVDGVNYSYATGIQASVKNLQDKFDAIKKKYTRKKDIREITTEATDIVREGVNTAVPEGKELEQRLSERVWKLQPQVKDELTIQIKNAISMGLNPNQAKNWVVKYLNNSKLITMHVRDKDGNLVLSEEARKLHPGRGVYRDPLKNAERLLRTEIMAAYRKAEIEQYQKTDLVIGYEIKLSGNHTTSDGKGGFKNLKDICDTLQGKYPKTFVWHGWHPNCRCVLLPIYASDEMMDSYFEAKHNGTIEDWNKKNQISVFPDNFGKWVQDNSERISAAQTAKNKQLPQWMNDEVKKKADMQNFELFKSNVQSKLMMSKADVARIGVEELTAAERKTLISEFNFISSIFYKKPIVRFSSQPIKDDDDNMLMGIGNGSLTIPLAKYMLKKTGHSFSPSRLLLNAFPKLIKGDKLDFDEEYMIEAIFHESVHSYSTAFFKKGSIDEIIYETCTQLYAREKYIEILKMYSPKYENPEHNHQEAIRKNGYGYNRACSLVRSILGSKLPIGDLKGVANGNLKPREFLKSICKKKGIDFESVSDFLREN